MFSPAKVLRKLGLTCLFLGSLTFYGCDMTGSSAKDMLVDCAKALEQNDASAFVGYFDMAACASTQIQNVTKGNDALNTLDLLGRNLGIGGMEDLLGNVFDLENSLRQDFVKKSSTGVLAKECSKKEETGCPWVPISLRQADVKEFAPNQAVARVKTPAGLTTWLALAKKDKGWLIVGWAPLEMQAKEYTESFIQGREPKTIKPKTKPKSKGKEGDEPLTI